MPIEHFKVANQKALQLAECEKVPRLMVIAGPNGVGKSTLLYALKMKSGEIKSTGKVLYLSAHRVWRRQQVQMPHLWEVNRSFTDLLVQNSISSFGGLRILDGSRGPDSADESFSAVKYTLSQFETRKQNAVNVLLERDGTVTREQVGDIYQPIRDLTRFLLPHLTFKSIDLSQRTNVKVLFERNDSAGSVVIELDDLSSGERALVSMFMPFLETAISDRLHKIETAAEQGASNSNSDIVVLIDEPEIHLHPYLQARLLEYLRALSDNGQVQFIVATHSPSILDAADFDELFVLQPPSKDGDNQLVQLATSADRLSLLRQLSGPTYSLTVGRKLLCVEGEFPSAQTNHATDVRLLELACPELSAYVMIPFGGKAATIRAADRLRELLPKQLGLDSVQALVDLDDDHVDGDGRPWIQRLPVAMVENLLLSADAIWEVLVPQKERISFNHPSDIREKLIEIARSRRDDEIGLRVRRRVRFPRLKAAGNTASEILDSADSQILSIRKELPGSEELSTQFSNATIAVQGILDRGEELELFHGKEILRRFHHLYVRQLGIEYDAFCLQVARTIGRSETLRKKVLAGLKGIIGSSAAAAAATLTTVEIKTTS